MHLTVDSCKKTGGDGGLTPKAHHIEEIVKVAHDEMRRLMAQRAGIMRRILIIKQTIAGLCSLFDGDELSDELRELVNPTTNERRSGLTQACRAALIRTDRPMNVQEICEEIQQHDASGSRFSKNLAGSISVTLRRLVQSGEAQTIIADNGRKAWTWARVDVRSSSFGKERETVGTNGKPPSVGEV